MTLSVLITYHNEGAWLTECLNSIAPQLGKQDEILVFDDASSAPARDYLIVDARVRVLEGGPDNIGPAAARNRLLANATGELIHFHDADDLFAADWYRRVTPVFAGDVDVVFTDVQSFSADGRRWTSVMSVERLQQHGDLLDFAIHGGVLVPSGTYRRELLDKVGGYRAEMWQSEDYDFHMRLALRNPRFRVIDEDLVLIRRHPGQRSRAAVEVWSSALDALEHLAPQFPHTAHDAVAAIATRAGSELFHAGAGPEARRAFGLAQRFGGARYDRPMMQNLTRLLGAMSAERIASAYRKLLPGALRQRVQKTGL
jgi:glycosyltransferase involved in cell wall biosynthesis